MLTGVQLVIDIAPLEDILSLLQWRIARLRARERAEAQIFRSMASFAPAFGMIGTLLVLISQKRNPSFVRETLRSFMAQYQDDIHDQPEVAPELLAEAVEDSPTVAGAPKEKTERAQVAGAESAAQDKSPSDKPDKTAK